MPVHMHIHGHRMDGWTDRVLIFGFLLDSWFGILGAGQQTFMPMAIGYAYDRNTRLYGRMHIHMLDAFCQPSNVSTYSYAWGTGTFAYIFQFPLSSRSWRTIGAYLFILYAYCTGYTYISWKFGRGTLIKNKFAMRYWELPV